MVVLSCPLFCFNFFILPILIPFTFFSFINSTFSFAHLLFELRAVIRVHYFNS